MKIVKKLWLLPILCVAIVAFNSCEKESEELPVGHPTEENGVEINGIVWATRNVGSFGTFAARPESPGMFYQWNRPTAWYPSGSVSGWDSTPAEGETWETENDPCPPGWRVPTQEELNNLRQRPNEWTTENGVEGRRFGTAPYQIFLPAAGHRGNNEGTPLAQERDRSGSYWSSTSGPNAANGVELFINSSRAVIFNTYNRAFAQSIRCVAVDN